MTYEDVIEWVIANIDVHDDDNFNSWYARANQNFLDNNRNDLDSILPQSFIDEIESFFTETSGGIKEAFEPITEEIPMQEVLQIEPEKEPSIIENTIESVKGFLGRLFGR